MATGQPGTGKPRRNKRTPRASAGNTMTPALTRSLNSSINKLHTAFRHFATQANKCPGVTIRGI